MTCTKVFCDPLRPAYSISRLVRGMPFFAWLLLGLSLLSSVAVAADPQHAFLSVADIHLDPFAGCPAAGTSCPLLKALEAAEPGQWKKIFSHYGSGPIQAGKDSNFPLFESTLSRLRTLRQAIHPDFAVIPGDFLAHEYHDRYLQHTQDPSLQHFQAFVKKTLQFMTDEIRQTLPGLPVYITIGNNDSYTGDYSVIPHGNFLAETAPLWASLIPDRPGKQALMTHYPEAGYYAITPPGVPTCRIILANTVLFSPSATAPDSRATAAKELRWLHTELQAAKAAHQHVLMAFHIPPGFNAYAFLHSKKPVTFWKRSYSRVFEGEMQQFQPVISALLPAHLHSSRLGMLLLKMNGPAPFFLTPSVSPIFGNDPSFRVFYYDPDTCRITDQLAPVYSLKKQAWSD